MTNRDSVLESRDITLLTKIHNSQGYGLPSGHIWLWELDCKGNRMQKNWWLWNVMLEKTPESPLGSKEIKPVNLKGNQPWILIGRTDAEAEVPVFWSSDANSWLIGKFPDARKDWRQKEKIASEDEMAIIASLMQWTRTWAHFRRWWRIGKPGVLQSVGSQRAGNDGVIGQQCQYHTILIAVTLNLVWDQGVWCLLHHSLSSLFWLFRVVLVVPCKF